MEMKADIGTPSAISGIVRRRTADGKLPMLVHGRQRPTSTNWLKAAYGSGVSAASMNGAWRRMPSQWRASSTCRSGRDRPWCRATGRRGPPPHVAEESPVDPDQAIPNDVPHLRAAWRTRRVADGGRGTIPHGTPRGNRPPSALASLRSRKPLLRWGATGGEARGAAAARSRCPSRQWTRTGTHSTPSALSAAQRRRASAPSAKPAARRRKNARPSLVAGCTTGALPAR